MHVLFIPSWFETPALPTAGKAIKDLALALSNQGLKINILFQSHATLPLQSNLTQGIEIWHSPCQKRGNLYPIWNSTSLQAYLRTFRDYILRHQIPDLIHVHGYAVLPIANLLKSKFGIPFIYTEHGSNILQRKTNFIVNYLIHKMVAHASATTAVSKALSKELYNITTQFVQVIPNTIDFNYFVPGTSTEDIIMINLLNKNKQVGLGMLAFDLWSKEHPESKLHIIGDGPQKQSLEQLASHLHCKNKIYFHGEVSSNYWLPLLQSARYLLLMSKSETFGVVALEALACQVPVISLNNQGLESISELIELELLPLNSTASFIYEKMKQKENESISYEKRNNLKSQFDYPIVANQYMSLYSRIISTSL